jgi:hypothetical protein
VFRIVRDIPVSSTHAQTPSCGRLGVEAKILKERSHHPIAEGDTVVVRYRFTGTHRGPLADIPASGKRVSLTNGFGIFRVVAGKVNEGHFAWDKYALLEQVGALGPSSAARTEAAV